MSHTRISCLHNTNNRIFGLTSEICKAGTCKIPDLVKTNKYKFLPTIDTKYENGQHFCMVDEKFVKVRDALPGVDLCWDMIGFSASSDLAIVECKVQRNKEKGYLCTFHKWRRDKTSANQKKTIEAILQEVDQHITLQELVRATQSSQQNKLQEQ